MPLSFPYRQLDVFFLPGLSEKTDGLVNDLSHVLIAHLAQVSHSWESYLVLFCLITIIHAFEHYLLALVESLPRTNSFKLTDSRHQTTLCTAFC